MVLKIIKQDKDHHYACMTKLTAKPLTSNLRWTIFIGHFLKRQPTNRKYQLPVKPTRSIQQSPAEAG